MVKCDQLQPKVQCKAVLTVYIAAKTLYPPFITSKTERFKSGYVGQVAKHLKGEWFIVLHKQLWLKTTLCCF